MRGALSAGSMHPHTSTAAAVAAYNVVQALSVDRTQTGYAAGVCSRGLKEVAG